MIRTIVGRDGGALLVSAQDVSGSGMTEPERASNWTAALQAHKAYAQTIWTLIAEYARTHNNELPTERWLLKQLGLVP